MFFLKVWWLHATLFDLLIFLLRHTMFISIVEAHSGFFTADAQQRDLIGCRDGIRTRTCRKQAVALLSELRRTLWATPHPNGKCYYLSFIFFQGTFIASFQWSLTLTKRMAKNCCFFQIFSIWRLRVFLKEYCAYSLVLVNIMLNNLFLFRELCKKYFGSVLWDVQEYVGEINWKLPQFL